MLFSGSENTTPNDIIQKIFRVISDQNSGNYFKANFRHKRGFEADKFFQENVRNKEGIYETAIFIMQHIIYIIHIIELK